MNGKKKATIGAGTAVMTTVIAVGVIAIFRGSSENSAALVEHELSVESHPVINTKVDSIAGSVDKMAGNVETMMLRQEGQSVTLKHMADDIAELKEGG